ncbi:unnamed protein product, partial [marine sediment metagenome]
EGIVALSGIVVGGNQGIDYSVREVIQETELRIAKQLPKAWNLWKRYEGETLWGNEMFFIWDARTHWAKASGALIDLQKYLQDQVNLYEKAQREKVRVPEPIAKLISFAQDLPVETKSALFVSLGIVAIVVVVFFVTKRS